jgi:hypothetical protein
MESLRKPMYSWLPCLLPSWLNPAAQRSSPLLSELHGFSNRFRRRTSASLSSGRGCNRSCDLRAINCLDERTAGSH